jgi:hypothetical protein
MRWQLHYLRNCLLGLLPGRSAIRRLRNRFRHPMRQMDMLAFEQGLELMRALAASGQTLKNADVLEIGPGMTPSPALLCVLGGSRSVTLLDTQRLLDRRAVMLTLEGFREHADEIAEALHVDRDQIRSRLADTGAGLSLDALLDHFKIAYLAPQDLTRTAIGARSLQVILSRAVLEHIPPDALRNMLARCRELLRDGGVMAHIIDNSDHRQHGDSRLSPVDFLRYSDRAYRVLSALHPRNYQNRLRHDDYLRLFRNAGFEIVRDVSAPDPRALQDLQTMPLASKYAASSREDLAILTCLLIVRPAKSAAASGGGGRSRVTVRHRCLLNLLGVRDHAR